MDDLDFFDTLYQGWSKTTWAENAYWMPEESEDFPGLWDIVAVNEKEERKPIAAFLSEEDAAFITALHGCMADLVRRLHQAVDEAERFEIEKDNVISEMAQLAVENNDLRAQLNGNVVG